MDLELDGKVAIVTGGASGGLGESMAARPPAEGCRVLVADRDAERNAGLVARLSQLGEVSERASFIAGQTLQVCGGWVFP
jgi:NAD(P)-dependent dehydrogenase (short-subunit alcohol dehydrogenase family)